MSELRYALLKENIADAVDVLQDQPIVNINLVTFHQTADAPAVFQRYFMALRGLIRSAGGDVVYSGQVTAGKSVIHTWEAVAIVYYPSMRAYQQVIDQDAFLRIKHMRKSALQWSVLYAATGLRLPPKPFATQGGSAVMIISRRPLSGVMGDLLGGGVVGQRLLVGEAGYAPWRYFALTRDTSYRAKEGEVVMSLNDVPPEAQILPSKM